jgi:hypothetical protein
LRARSGTTVRLGVSPGACAIFVNCNTSLLATYRDLNPDVFAFEGDCALVLPAGGALPVEAVRHCVRLARTYNRKARA